MIFAEVKSIIFKNKQNIPWNDVEDYLKGFIGIEIIVKEYGDVIHIQGDFPDEFTESRYTKKLRGALAKAKANAAQVIVEMLENAKNRYLATAVVRIKDGKLYLYDIINIKKEASTPL